MWYSFKIWIFKSNGVTEIHKLEISANSEEEAIMKADLEGDILSGHTGKYDFKLQPKSTQLKYFPMDKRKGEKI